MRYAIDHSLKISAWLTSALFIAHICVAMSLAVTGLFVISDLHLSAGHAGLAVGVSFMASLFSRGYAGSIADTHGGKRCMVYGFLSFFLAALIGALASMPQLSPVYGYVLLFVGRVVLGIGVSFTVVGLLSWCFFIMGPTRSGSVFALVGLGLYGALAIGSPIAVYLAKGAGFIGVMTVCAGLSMIGCVMILPVKRPTSLTGERLPFWRVMSSIRGPGAVLAFAGVGSAVIAAFTPLFFASRGWSDTDFSLSAFGGGFVMARILFGDLPDRLGGVRVGLGALATEVVGQYLLFASGQPHTALVGAFVSGLGCSLMFPSMGLEAVRRVPLHLSGTAAGGLSAYQDLAFGLTAPLAGIAAHRYGYGSVFLIGGMAAALSIPLLVLIERGGRSRIDG